MGYKCQETPLVRFDSEPAGGKVEGGRQLKTIRAPSALFPFILLVDNLLSLFSSRREPFLPSPRPLDCSPAGSQSLPLINQLPPIKGPHRASLDNYLPLTRRVHVFSPTLINAAGGRHLHKQRLAQTSRFEFRYAHGICLAANSFNWNGFGPAELATATAAAATSARARRNGERTNRARSCAGGHFEAHDARNQRPTNHLATWRRTDRDDQRRA